MPLVVVVEQAVWVCTRDDDCLSGTAALCQVYFVRDFYFVSGTLNLLSETPTVCQGLLLFVKCILSGTSTLFQGLLNLLPETPAFFSGTRLCQRDKISHLTTTFPPLFLSALMQMQRVIFDDLDVLEQQLFFDEQNVHNGINNNTTTTNTTSTASTSSTSSTSSTGNTLERSNSGVGVTVSFFCTLSIKCLFLHCRYSWYFPIILNNSQQYWPLLFAPLFV